MGGRREIADGMVQAAISAKYALRATRGRETRLHYRGRRPNSKLKVTTAGETDESVSVELPLSRRFRQTNLEHFEAEQNIAVGGRRKQLFGRSEATILGNLQSYLEMILMETL